ncbi:hypothetical protein C2E19_28160 [Pseudomonas sp. DTU12.3]|uniref:hypothetical protein n=1 Tax=Pseudomonas sp. DTU12.3 TaxID=2073078 RepID=UPI0010111B8F|nr:hypothetical protein [Pseudomonas sp. DTU12.3]QAX87479.1 hypothetical protein C2E19_28160 [Pseudomonas sp. DTU12.3]
MKHLLRIASLGGCLASLAGCASSPPNTFTFTADMPPDFSYVAAVYYVPAKGETCTVATKNNLAPVFNDKWRTEYKPDAEIIIRRTRSGCPLVISRIELEMYATYGKDRGDFGAHAAIVVVRDEVEELDKRTFNEAGESAFYGQCQWMFRTAGSKRRIVKLLDCKNIDAQGEPARGRPFAAYTLDQLPGKTVRMHIKLADEERPGWGDTWVKVPNGWKRCLGKGFEDQRGYCNGNYTDFSTFQMPDGRQCTIYPGCTE